MGRRTAVGGGDDGGGATDACGAGYDLEACGECDSEYVHDDAGEAAGDMRGIGVVRERGGRPQVCVERRRQCEGIRERRRRSMVTSEVLFRRSLV